VACYNGKNLQGWRTVGGTWIPGQNDGEGGQILTGTKGALAYPLLRPAGSGKSQPLLGYRIVALADVHNADAAELQFGLASEKDLSHAVRCVVRLMIDRVQLGTRSADDGPLDEVLVEQPLASNDSGFHELRVERHSCDWFIAVDDTLIGSILVPNMLIRPEFLLAAEGNGMAWFSDILLEELAAPATP
jgi:hypothetical protein